MPVKGKIIWVSGPAVKADNMMGAKMYEVAHCGEEGLIGEIIKLTGDVAFIQVYENTSGLTPGEPVQGTGQPLSVALGPGMVGSVYDGVQRPLDRIRQKAGAFVTRGIRVPPLPTDKKWHFEPKTKKGEEAEPGDIIGTVQETPLLECRIIIPPDAKPGKITNIAEQGEYTVQDKIAELNTKQGEQEIKLAHNWPVRQPRPHKQRLNPEVPLITGQRVLDTFFPLSKGGTGCIPGAFGTGKCVPPETPILLSDGSMLTIEEIFSSASRSSTSERDEATIELPNPFEIISFDGVNLREDLATHIYRGRADALVELRTASGRRIRVTLQHKLYLFNSETAEFEETPAAYIRTGDYLVMPRRLTLRNDYQTLPLDGLDDLRVEGPREIVRETIESAIRKFGTLKSVAQSLGYSYGVLIEYRLGRNKPTLGFVKRLATLSSMSLPKELVLKARHGGKQLRIPSIVDERFGEFLGLLLSDGMITPRSVRFFSDDETLRDRFRKLSEELFELKGMEKRFRTVKGVELNSVALVTVLNALGFPTKQKSRNAYVPKLIMESPDSVVAAFLRGYFLGDGGFHKGVVEISTASAQMSQHLTYLLVRLGVLCTLTSRRKSYRVIISGVTELSKFAQALGSDVHTHPRLLQMVDYANLSNPNRVIRDVVPLSPALLAAALRGYVSQLRQHGFHVYNYLSNSEKIGVQMLQRMANSISPSSPESTALIRLSQSLEDVFLDCVKDVKVVKGDWVVYDLTVQGFHNFIGGQTPTLYHNTVTLHQLARWSDAKVIFHVGCGERGNEEAEVLTTFPDLTDPYSGHPLMERTVLVANTSNMPVAAREASVYTGVTMAEFYRDMGYDVLLVADSTSRWAEALREISGRLEEMPAEEGYPSYLASRLAEFYERAGRVVTIGRPERVGSVSLVGAVSPPGGDFTEPVTTHTMRFIRTFWGLDANLAYSRHYPAVNWITSYSGYVDTVRVWWIAEIEKEWSELRAYVYRLLQRENELLEIVRLLGPEALPDDEKLILDVARIVREGFLQQSAYDTVDSYCSPVKQVKMLHLFREFHRQAEEALKRGVGLRSIRAMPIIPKLIRAKYEISNDEHEKIDFLREEASLAIGQLVEKASGIAGS